MEPTDTKTDPAAPVIAFGSSDGSPGPAVAKQSDESPLYVEPEDYDQLKAIAARASDGNPNILVLRIDDIDPPRDIVMRMPKVDEWIRYYDMANEDGDDAAAAQFAATWTIYPPRAEMTRVLSAARRNMSLLPVKLADAIGRAVGANKLNQRPLTRELLEDDDLLLEYGLTRDVARSLLSANPAKGALRLVRITVSPEGAEDEEYVYIVVHPLGPALSQLKIGLRTSARYAACRNAANTAIVKPQSTAERAKLMQDYPGICCGVLLQLMLEMSGSNAQITAKKA